MCQLHPCESFTVNNRKLFSLVLDFVRHSIVRREKVRDFLIIIRLHGNRRLPSLKRRNRPSPMLQHWKRCTSGLRWTIHRSMAVIWMSPLVRHPIAKRRVSPIQRATSGLLYLVGKGTRSWSGCSLSWPMCSRSLLEPLFCPCTTCFCGTQELRAERGGGCTPNHPRPSYRSRVTWLRTTGRGWGVLQIAVQYLHCNKKTVSINCYKCFHLLPLPYKL